MRTAALLLSTALLAVPATADEPAAAVQLPPKPALTGKERLGGKASDEQRVDNCKVPAELRGGKQRPDTCEPARPEAVTQ